MKNFNRRTFLGATTGMTLGGMLPSNLFASSAELKIGGQEENFKAYLRLLGSLQSATVYTWFSGQLWGIVPGTPAKPLVTFEGCAKSIWQKEGDTLSKQSFDIGYFGDLETGDIISEYENPFTNKVVHPYHYQYGGGSKTIYANGTSTSGKTTKNIEPTWTKAGGQIWLEEISSASFDNPFNPTEWGLSSAGEKIHFGSASTYVASEKDLFDSQKKSCPYTLFWTAINSWEPWLLMGDSPGYVMWRATGVKIMDVAEIPDSIKNYAKKIQPNYFEKGAPWEGRKSTWLSYMEDRKSLKK